MDILGFIDIGATESVYSEGFQLNIASFQLKYQRVDYSGGVAGGTRRADRKGRFSSGPKWKVAVFGPSNPSIG